MENPRLPDITPINCNSQVQIKDKKNQNRTMRSNLKKTLSKEARTLENFYIFSEDHNQFIIEDNDSMRIVTKSIIHNNNLEEPLLSSDIRKKLKFSQTQIHEVENWKEYNKVKHCCCFHSFI